MAKVALIYIDGEILPESYIWPEDQATSLYRVRKQVEAAGEFDSIQLNIFSPGGYCLEGWAIVDYLLSLGKPIDTLAYGQCASFGTVFHTMGKVRQVSQHCDYVVHRPWDFFMGNDLQIDEDNAKLKKETTKLFDWYAPPTGKTVDELAALIQKDDLKLSPQETVDNGFSTAIYNPGPAAAAGLRTLNSKKPTYLLSLKDRKPNPNAPKEETPKSSTQSIQNNTMAEKKKSLIAAAKALLGILDGDETKALDVPLKDGRTLVTNSTGDVPLVGDTAQIDGADAPDGDYELEDGTIVTVATGVITAVAAADDTATGESADPAASATDAVALKLANTQLQAKVDQLEARQTETETRMRTILAGFISEEVPTQANRVVTPKATGNKPKSEEEQARETMLANHVAKFAKPQAAQA